MLSTIATYHIRGMPLTIQHIMLEMRGMPLTIQHIVLEIRGMPLTIVATYHGQFVLLGTSNEY